MSEPYPFVELIRRVRTGDEVAATLLVRTYESEIRREVRVWLRVRNPGLRREFDSIDICQSVLASFFVRAAAGQYDLDRPEQLGGLLAAMARNKLAQQVKLLQRQRRDIRRSRTLEGQEDALARKCTSPSELVAGKELLDEIRQRLSDEERQLSEMRSQGRSWSEIATELGGSSEGRRKQLTRAIDRIMREMGLEELLPT
jgi:RNA polymerase sigma-70 factor (ECF subfamily)